MDTSENKKSTAGASRAKKPFLQPDGTEWTGSGTLLIVDDEISVRTMLKKMLELAGYQVLLASDGVEAMDLFNAHAQEIRGVILDLTMPNKNGVETFDEIRRLCPDMRILISSGYNAQETVQWFSEKGRVGFIPKPYQLETLQVKVKELFG